MRQQFSARQDEIQGAPKKRALDDCVTGAWQLLWLLLFLGGC